MSRVPAFRFSPLLATESTQEFEACRSEFYDHLDPRDPIERLYCEEFSRKYWEALRWHRAAVACLNLAMPDALYEVLVEKLGVFEPGPETVSHLAKWSTHGEVRKEISDILAKHNLDESAIEAEAFRQRSADLMKFDYLLASAESRRDKVLHSLAAYRDGFGQKLQRKTIELENEAVPRLESKERLAGG